MPSSSNTSIAKKARTKAEADFATWLMMAKLGGFDDLPSNAQSFLTNYRTRLGTISEAESTTLAIREVYSAYYSEMGGVGAAPEPKARTPATERKVVRFQRRPKLAGGPVFDPPIGRERVDWDPTTTKAWRSVKLGHGGDIRVTKSFQKLKTDIASGRVNVRW